MIRLEKATFLGSVKRLFFLQGVVITETEYRCKVSEDWHYHVNNHLTLILHGGNLEQRKNAEVQAIPGKVLAYPMGMPHRNRHTVHPSRNINLEIEDAFLHQYNLNFSVPGIEDISFFLLKIYNECFINDNDSKTSIQSLLLSIFQSRDRNITSGTSQRVALIKEVLNDRWNENISLSELSDALGVHPVTVSKAFPKYFGCTLGEYSRRLKIHRAIHLMKSSNRPITEIALECGFFDQSHFTKTFKSLTGCTPRDFKNL